MFQNIFLKEKSRNHNLDVETVTPTSNSSPNSQKLAIWTIFPFVGPDRNSALIFSERNFGESWPRNDDPDHDCDHSL